MLERIHLLACFLCFALVTQAQNIRTFDGSNNNLANPDYGAVESEMVTKVSNGFGDYISTPGGTDRPHPRTISNDLFAQNGVLSDPLNLSDFLWVYGQFIDHDVTLVGNDATEDASMLVDFYDVHFNPSDLPNVRIPMFRSKASDGSGTSITNPRKYTNSITAFIDGSGVYGSDQHRADYLRSNVDGKLRVSSGNLMPWNTVTGEAGAAHDPGAPEMDNENPFNDELFLAGDPRANENPLLASFHTLFVREHNRLCDEIKADNPSWNDEQIYQQARKFVGGFIQNITYAEWLPAMGVNLPTYAGYDSSINPGISNVFSAAAFRLGHTLLNSNIVRVNNDGDTIPEGNLLLRDGFFQPHRILDEGGLDPLFKGMGIQVEQTMDAKIVDDVRNFLFGPPGAGGLDLASININRGRERGLPDFNTVRANFGMFQYNSINDLTSNPQLRTALTNLYGNADLIDPWVGMLAEDPVNGALFGETIMEIMKDQFGRLRDGDRFYFENDPVLTNDEKDEIRNTTLRDIIMRNSGITLMQDNVFLAMPHDSICSAQNASASLAGTVLTMDGDQVSDVTISVVDANNQPVSSGSALNGVFAVDDISSCEHVFVSATKDGHFMNGVNTLDLILISKHLLSIETLDSPYKIIAADVNNNGSLNIGDLIEIRKAILVINTEFTNNSSWRLIDANYVFNDPTQPLSEDFPELIDQGYVSSNANADFIAIKVGDVSGNANPSSIGYAVDRNYIDDEMIFSTKDRKLKKGETYKVDFNMNSDKEMKGFQYTLAYDQMALNFLDVSTNSLGKLTKENFGVFEEQGLITSSWYGDKLNEEEELFSITFKATKDALLSEVLSMNSELTKAEAYNENLEILDLGLDFEPFETTELAAIFSLGQNEPNPFTKQTKIAFQLPESAEITLSLYDLSGKMLTSYNASFEKGENAFEIDTNDFPSKGMLYYTLDTPFGSETRKMIVTE